MRRNNTLDPTLAKQIARQKYAERQIDNWIKWSIENRGKLLFKELVEMQNKHGVNCHG